MNQDDNIPRSDPYQVPIPPPPPGFSHEPTVPSYFEQLMPTTPISPPPLTPTVKASPPIHTPVPPRRPKQIKAFSKRTALIAWGSMFGVICLCALLILIAVVTRPWTTVREYTGSGGSVVTLTAPTYWRVSWRCDLQPGESVPQPFIVDASVNGSRQNVLVSDTCQANHAGASAQQTQGGTVTLYITADPTSSWTIDIQT